METSKALRPGLLNQISSALSAFNLIGKRSNGVQKAVVVEKQQSMGSEKDPVYVSQPQECCVFMSGKYIFFYYRIILENFKIEQ